VLRHPTASKELSGTDGFPRRTLRGTTMSEGGVSVVRGLDEIDRLLRAIQRGETAPCVVDMLCCEGCIDGPCVSPEMSVFAKRSIDVAERERQPPPAVDSRTFLSALPEIELHRTFAPDPVSVHDPTAEELDNVLAAGEFSDPEDHLDCGLCGYDTCVEHARAIWMGNSTWSMCFPLERKRLLREHERLAEASFTDDLTGLLNRRALDARLAEETARAERYGSPLSLVVIDLDNFKEVNDHFGHAAGDALLKAVGVLMRAELRTADIAARYGGDEFALVLPGVTKTGAWAVAEKVLGSLRTLATDSDVGLTINVTCSVGVASFGEAYRDAEGLFRGADSALYAAKRAGRNRVELAAG
jgi:diguanylate cyclase (GGDEF)-like protein